MSFADESRPTPVPDRRHLVACRVGVGREDSGHQLGDNDAAALPKNQAVTLIGQPMQGAGQFWDNRRFRDARSHSVSVMC